MKAHKYAIIITGIIWVVALFSSLIIYCVFGSVFWIGVLQGVFGSAILVFTIEIIGYFNSRRNVLEDFLLQTQRILRKLNMYERNFPIDKKIEYFLQINDSDYILWEELGRIYARIDFIFDFNNKVRKYIFDAVYKPLEKVKSEIVKHSPNFKEHLDGSGHNDEAMKKYIKTIEPMILEVNVQDINGIKCTGVRNKIVEEISGELNGRFSKIMYGKKTAETLREEANEFVETIASSDDQLWS